MIRFSERTGVVMEYMSCPEAAKKWGISERRVQILCREKRIQGVSKLGYMWLIPKDAENRLTVEPNKERSYTMNKVLIIDDDKELCALIKRSVLSEDIEADFCNTGKEGLQKLKEREYQLVILDVMMPGMDGFETLEEIRKESSLPILMFTSKNDSASKVRGLRAGAEDYLTKPFDMDELIARLVSLIRRYTRFNQQDGISQQLEFDGLKIDIENRSVTTENGTFELPPKEFDLLLYCAKNQGKILTKQQIYEEVWREEYFYDDSNIMAIISRLRKKLEVNPGSPKYIQTIKGIGYRFNKEV